MKRSPALFPKPRKRMKQPRKDTLRHIIRCRDAEIYRLKAELSKSGLLMRAISKARGLLRLIKRTAT